MIFLGITIGVILSCVLCTLGVLLAYIMMTQKQRDLLKDAVVPVFKKKPEKRKPRVCDDEKAFKVEQERALER